ncbi:MAG: hypothetical protein AB7E55_06145 [Pigmentiphaga sp.]
MSLSVARRHTAAARFASGLIGILLLWLSGCTPAHDWRELSAANGAIRVAFPAKPTSETRPLPVGERILPFTLMAAEADGAVFAVGHLDVPALEDGPSSDEIGAALADSLVRLFPDEHVRQEPVVIRHSRAGRSSLPGLELQAENPDDPAAPRLLARVFRQDGRWIQIVALGTPQHLPWDAARWFVESARLL